MPMTVTRQLPPTEADLRRRLATSDEVRVRDKRSGYVGTLYRVGTRHVVALTVDGHADYRIPFNRLEIVDEGQDEAADEANDEAADEAEYGEGDWVAPTSPELRQVRPPGVVVRVQQWSVGPQWLTVLPPKSTDRWQMPANGVHLADPQATP